ncbi:MAG: DUF2065 family protein [Rhodobacteraceae bacterium]|nr:DUF2065 family protein [Paracoccaceae bacterium]
MIDDFVLALGLAAVFEGMVIVLVPRHALQILNWLSRASVDERRTAGLLCVTLGVFLAWLARTVLA